MEKCDISASRICRHYDITGKRRPAYYVNGTNWNSLKAAFVSNQDTNAPKIDVIYMAKVDGKWLSPVTNFNNINYNGYACITNKLMTAVAIKVGKGSIRYRIHAKEKIVTLGSLAMI